MDHAARERWRAKDVARLLALLEAERRYYSEIVAALPVPVALLGGNRAILSANRALRELVGLSADELAKLRIEDLTPIPNLAEQFHQALTLEEPRPFHAFGLVVTRSGPRPVRLTGVRSQSWEEGGEPEFLVTLEDATAPRDAVPVAPEYREEPSASPGTAPSRMWRFPALGWELDATTMRVTSAGGSSDVIPGLPPEQLVEFTAFPGPHIHALDRERYSAFYEELRSGARSSGQCEYRGAAPGEAATWLLDTATAESDAEGRTTSISVVTVAIAETRLRQRQQEQAQALDSMARVTGRVAHNANNLLMIISGYCEDLAETHPDDSQMQADLDEIRKASERLGAFVARLEGSARKVAPPATVFDLNELLREVGTRLGPEKASPRAGLATLLVRANREDVERAISLVAGMAGKPLSLESFELDWPFALDGEPNSLPAGSYAVVPLAVGGDEEVLRRAIVEPNLDTAAPGEGAPSLAAVHRALQMNGAGMVVWDDGGGECSLFLLVPKAPQDAEAVKPPPAPPTAPRTILIVEDERGIRSLMAKILSRQGYQVWEAESCSEALRLAEEKLPEIDLLLADVQVGGESGREFSDRLRALRPSMHVLFISGYSDDPVIQKALASGEFPPGVSFLQKPFTLGSLLGRVRDSLEI